MEIGENGVTMAKKVRFLQDFQGKETKELFYKQGQEIELPDHVAQLLVTDRRAELVDYPKPTTPEEFVKPVVFENVTAVESEQAFEELKEEVMEVRPDPEPEPKPKGKRGRK